jgi:hypothetical protein
MSDQTATYRIRFDNVSVADAATKAAQLRETLLQTGADLTARLEKHDSTTQDFGTTLVLVLGTPAALAIAKGIANYLSRDRGSITIEDGGKVIATGLTGKDAARIAEAFARKK